MSLEKEKGVDHNDKDDDNDGGSGGGGDCVGDKIVCLLW